jgi:hypothetical protein
MQPLPRHQHRYNPKQFPFTLYRLSDEEYSQLGDRSFPIQFDELFMFDIALDRANTSEELTLPKALVILEHKFGASSSRLDKWKQAFSFPLLLAIEKPNGTFYYLLRITDRRGSIDFDLFRIIDDLKYVGKNLTFSSQPLDDELSQTEIENVISYLWGFLEGFASHLDRWESEIKPFFRHIDSSHVIYGYWDGKFVEEEIEDPDEYEAVVRDLKAKYGKPKLSATERVASVQELIQAISQGVGE